MSIRSSLILALLLSLGASAHADGIVSTGLAAGQIPGTATNDNASAGNFGEYKQASCTGPTNTATVTITIASPGVVSWASHGFLNSTTEIDACPVVFTTSGALPTGITSGTVYYVVPSSIAAGSFQIATTVANALAGTSINTSGTQSGTQTGTAGAALATTTAKDMTGLSLTAGDWDCWASLVRGLAATTSVTQLKTSIVQTTGTDGVLATGTRTQLSVAANVMAADTAGMVGPIRQSLSATTTVFLDADDTFTVSTNKAYGLLACRRAR